MARFTNLSVHWPIVAWLSWWLCAVWLRAAVRYVARVTLLLNRKEKAAKIRLLYMFKSEWPGERWVEREEDPSWEQAEESFREPKGGWLPCAV